MVLKCLSVVRENLLLFASIVFAAGVFSSLPQPVGAMLAFFSMPVLVTQLAVKAYETALYGNRLRRRPNVDSFTLAMKAASLIVVALILRELTTAGVLIGYNGDKSISDISLFGDAVFGVSLCCILSYLGTWLPAAIHHVDTRFLAAAVRGNRTFLPVLVRLVFYSLIERCLLFLLHLGVLALGRYWQMDGLAHFMLEYFASVAEAALRAFLMIVYAFVLTKYYLKAEGMGTITVPVAAAVTRD